MCIPLLIHPHPCATVTASALLALSQYCPFLSQLFPMLPELPRRLFFFFNDTAPPEIYPLPLHAALPISDCCPVYVFPSRKGAGPARQAAAIRNTAATRFMPGNLPYRECSSGCTFQESPHAPGREW